MAGTTSEERNLRVLQRMEPDRVREVFCPGCKNHIDFALWMGWDMTRSLPI